MSYDAMREYLRRLYRWVPPTQISWEYLDWKDFDIISKEKSRLLQATDSIVGALSDGLEYTKFGNLEPRYILALRERFYRRGNNLFSYGMKFLHAKMGKPIVEIAEYKWLEEL